MKKLFTFFIAMVVVAMCFAQNGNKYEVIGIPIDQGIDRSDYIGWYAQSGYVHTQVAESEYFLFIPAGTFDTIVTLEKVRFYTIPSANITNYTGAEFTLDNDFDIRIYTGASVNGLDFNPGTMQYHQSYNPTTAGAEAGAQTITLTTAFTANPSDNIAIGIYSAGLSSMGLCDDDPDCIDVNFALWPEYDEGIHHYYWTGLADPHAWAYDTYTVREHDPWNLSVFYNDGEPYRPKSDWYAEMYRPEDTQEYPDEVEWVKFDEYTDSLYVYIGAFNRGIDTSYGFYKFNIYIDGENPIYLDENDMVSDTAREYETGVGFRWRPDAFAGREELEQMGLNLEEGFEVCFSIEYIPDETYDGYDPNLENNTWCTLYSPTNPSDGIIENTNTLSVSPNPASTTLTVENAAGARILVYNIAGQEVMSIEAAEANATLNVSDLNAGLYIVRVVNGNEVSTAKVNIVR